MSTLVETLLIQHTPSLRQTAEYLTKDHSKSNDLFQETAERIIRYREHFTSGTNFKAWAITIMRNLFINEYRKVKNQRKWIPDAQRFALTTLPSPDRTVRNEGEERLYVMRINHAIERLDPKMRSTFQMYREGYQYQEIAEKMHEPIGTVKSRIHHARKYLKTELTEYGLAG